MNNSGRLLVVCVVLGYTTKDLQFKWLHKATGGLGWKKGGKAENSLIVNRKLTCQQVFAKASFQFRGSIGLSHGLGSSVLRLKHLRLQTLKPLEKWMLHFL